MTKVIAFVNKLATAVSPGFVPRVQENDDKFVIDSFLLLMRAIDHLVIQLQTRHKSTEKP